MANIYNNNGRLKAALRTGLDKVPIKRVEDGDTDKQQSWMNSREVENNSSWYLCLAHMTADINDNQERQYTMYEVDKMSKNKRNKLLNCKTKKKMMGHNFPEEHQNSQEK